MAEWRQQLDQAKEAQAARLEKLLVAEPSGRKPSGKEKAAGLLARVDYLEYLAYRAAAEWELELELMELASVIGALPMNTSREMKAVDDFVLLHQGAAAQAGRSLEDSIRLAREEFRERFGRDPLLPRRLSGGGRSRSCASDASESSRRLRSLGSRLPSSGTPRRRNGSG